MDNIDHEHFVLSFEAIEAEIEDLEWEEIEQELDRLAQELAA